MSVMAGPDLNVTVDANVTGYERKVEQVERSTERWRRQLEDLESDLMSLERSLDDTTNQGIAKQEEALRRHQDALDETGRGLMVFGALTVAAFGLATNEAIQWESAWAGVTKTVDGSAAEMARLEDQLRQLATTLPATHEEIAAVAEAAGQLGVAREDVASFTKVMIDLAETTDLTADDAATSIAQMMNVMQTAPEDVGRVGAALVALGNDGASTESQILGMAQRIAGAGAQLGLTEGEVLAIANALASVGIEVEAGGSAISSVMKEIQLAISTGSEEVAEYAAVAGMSAEAFTSLWGQDAAAGLDAFVTGLGQVSASGGDAIKTLYDLDITQVRQSDALLRLAGSGDLLTDSLLLGNQAWADNTALLEEAAKRYATTESQVQVARNQLVDAGIDVGTVLLPALVAVVGTLSDLIRAWQDVPGPIRDTLVVVGLLVGGLALLSGGLMTARARVATFAASTAALEAGSLKSFRSGMASTATFLTGPYAFALAGAGIAVALLAAEHGKAAAEIESYRATLDEAGNATQATFEDALSNLAGEGWLDFANAVGISMEEVVAALTQGGDAMEELKAKIEAGRDDMGVKDQFWDHLTGDSDQFIENIINAREKIAEAEEQGRALAEGNEHLADSTGEASDSQDVATGAWEDGADAVVELTEEVKTLGEQLSELASAFLSQRAAGRAVSDSLREIRGALRDYREENDGLDGAFKKNTKSGDEFATMLDDLAVDYLKQIHATEELTGSQRKTMAVYRETRQSLIDMAQTLGKTKQEARDYAEEILGTPKMVKTMFDAETTEAAADARQLQRILEEAARDRTARIDITTYFHKEGYQTLGGLQEQAAGGIVRAFPGAPQERLT